MIAAQMFYLCLHGLTEKERFIYSPLHTKGTTDWEPASDAFDHQKQSGIQSALSWKH